MRCVRTIAGKSVTMCANADLKLVTKLPGKVPRRFYKCLKCQTVFGVEDKDNEVITSLNGKDFHTRKRQGATDKTTGKRRF